MDSEPTTKHHQHQYLREQPSSPRESNVPAVRSGAMHINHGSPVRALRKTSKLAQSKQNAIFRRFVWFVVGVWTCKRITKRPNLIYFSVCAHHFRLFDIMKSESIPRVNLRSQQIGFPFGVTIRLRLLFPNDVFRLLLYRPVSVAHQNDILFPFRTIGRQTEPAHDKLNRDHKKRGEQQQQNGHSRDGNRLVRFFFSFFIETERQILGSHRRLFAYARKFHFTE